MPIDKNGFWSPAGGWGKSKQDEEEKKRRQHSEKMGRFLGEARKNPYPSADVSGLQRTDIPDPHSYKPTFQPKTATPAPTGTPSPAPYKPTSPQQSAKPAASTQDAGLDALKGFFTPAASHVGPVKTKQQELAPSDFNWNKEVWKPVAEGFNRFDRHVRAGIPGVDEVWELATGRDSVNNMTKEYAKYLSDTRYEDGMRGAKSSSKVLSPKEYFDLKDGTGQYIRPDEQEIILLNSGAKESSLPEWGQRGTEFTGDVIGMITGGGSFAAAGAATTVKTGAALAKAGAPAWIQKTVPRIAGGVATGVAYQGSKEFLGELAHPEDQTLLERGKDTLEMGAYYGAYGGASPLAEKIMQSIGKKLPQAVQNAAGAAKQKFPGTSEVTGSVTEGLISGGIVGTGMGIGELAMTGDPKKAWKAVTGESRSEMAENFVQSIAFSFLRRFGGAAALHGKGGISDNHDIPYTIQNAVFNSLPDDLKDELHEARIDARKQGMDDATANDLIMDKLAETPEGATLIEKATHDALESFATAQQLMNKERNSKPQPVVPQDATGGQNEAIRRTDPFGTLIGFDPVAQQQQQPEQPRPATPSTRPQGPVPQFKQGDMVRLQGIPGVHQITNDLQGKKRTITGSDGKARHVPPQALMPFDGLSQGDNVTVAGREGTFTVADMRDGKRIRVTDAEGKEFHFGAKELSPSFSAPVEKAPEVPPSIIKQPVKGSGNKIDHQEETTAAGYNRFVVPVDGGRVIITQTSKNGAPSERYNDYFQPEGTKEQKLGKIVEGKLGFDPHMLTADEIRRALNGEDFSRDTENPAYDEWLQEHPAIKQKRKMDEFMAPTGDFNPTHMYRGEPVEIMDHSETQFAYKKAMPEGRTQGRHPGGADNKAQFTVIDHAETQDEPAQALHPIVSMLLSPPPKREPESAEAQEPAQAQPQSKPVDQVAIGDTVKLKGMGDQKFTVDGFHGNSMVNLTSEKGGTLSVHKQAIVEVFGSSATADKPKQVERQEKLLEQRKGEGGLKAGDRVKIRNGVNLITVEILHVNENGRYSAQNGGRTYTHGDLPFNEVEEVVFRAPELAVGDVITAQNPFTKKQDEVEIEWFDRMYPMVHVTFETKDGKAYTQSVSISSITVVQNEEDTEDDGIDEQDDSGFIDENDDYTDEFDETDEADNVADSVIPATLDEKYNVLKDHVAWTMAGIRGQQGGVHDLILSGDKEAAIKAFKQTVGTSGQSLDDNGIARGNMMGDSKGLSLDLYDDNRTKIKMSYAEAVDRVERQLKNGQTKLPPAPPVIKKEPKFKVGDFIRYGNYQGYNNDDFASYGYAYLNEIRHDHRGEPKYSMGNFWQDDSADLTEMNDLPDHIKDALAVKTDNKVYGSTYDGSRIRHIYRQNVLAAHQAGEPLPKVPPDEKVIAVLDAIETISKKAGHEKGYSQARTIRKAYFEYEWGNSDRKITAVNYDSKSKTMEVQYTDIGVTGAFYVYQSGQTTDIKVGENYRPVVKSIPSIRDEVYGNKKAKVKNEYIFEAPKGITAEDYNRLEIGDAVVFATKADPGANGKPRWIKWNGTVSRIDRMENAANGLNGIRYVDYQLTDQAKPTFQLHMDDVISVTAAEKKAVADSKPAEQKPAASSEVPEALKSLAKKAEQAGNFFDFKDALMKAESADGQSVWTHYEHKINKKFITVKVNGTPYMFPYTAGGSGGGGVGLPKGGGSVSQWQDRTNNMPIAAEMGYNDFLNMISGNPWENLQVQKHGYRDLEEFYVRTAVWSKFKVGAQVSWKGSRGQEEVGTISENVSPPGDRTPQFKIQLPNELGTTFKRANELTLVQGNGNEALPSIKDRILDNMETQEEYEAQKTKPRFKSGEFVVYNGKIYKVGTVYNKGYPGELVTLQTEDAVNAGQDKDVGHNVSWRDIERKVSGFDASLDPLDGMTQKELSAEAERLRVPSWGSKDEVKPRIVKAYRARAAMGDMTAEELQELTVEELEKIMLNADMLPTEANQKRNKASHIQRLLEWRDGRPKSESNEPYKSKFEMDPAAPQSAAEFAERLSADLDSVGTITDAQRKELDNVKNGKSRFFSGHEWKQEPWAVHKIYQETDGGPILVEFLSQSTLTNKGWGLSGPKRQLIEPNGRRWNKFDGIGDGIPNFDTSNYELIYTNPKVAGWGPNQEDKAPEMTADEFEQMLNDQQPQQAEQAEKQTRGRNSIDLTYNGQTFTVKKGDYVAARGTVAVVNKIEKDQITVANARGQELTVDADKVAPLDTLVSDKQKRAIQEYIRNDMARDKHLLYVGHSFGKGYNSLVVVYNTDDLKMGTFPLLGESLGAPTTPERTARPPKGSYDKGGKGFKESDYVKVWDIADYVRDETPAVAEADKPRVQQIADVLKVWIASGTEIKSADLFRISDDVYRGTQSEGRYTPKDAYDALELAVNQYLLEQSEMDLTARDAETVKANAEKLSAIQSKLPTQSKRTEEQERFQQFSTPPAIAYVASWVANIDSSDIVLEPSAGIGGMALFAKANGARVVVNELDPRRLEILRQMPFDQYFNEDGEQLHNIMPKDVQITAAIMNPPFSTSATRGVTNTKNSFTHVDQALKRLDPGGRLVAILGESMFGGKSKGFSEWIDKLSERGFTVRAAIGIDGKHYAKYGTSFNVQYVVIDKTRDVQSNPLMATVKTLEEVVDMLGGIANDRQRTADSYNGSQQDAGQSTGASNSVQNPKTRPNTSGNGRSGSSGSASTVGDSGQKRKDPMDEPGRDVQPADVAGTTSEPTEADGRTDDVRGNVDDNSEDATGEPNGSSDTDSGSVDQQEDRRGDNQNERRPGPRVKKELTDSVFEDYEPKKLNIKNAQKHPGELSESAAMSAIDLPDLDYKVSLSKEIIESGALSSAQLEVVAYAGQANSQMLPDGKTRKGFFVGDGTGVGKGRTMTGIIMDNFNHGRKKAVWFSENKGLLPSARRDWKDLGGDLNDLFGNVKNGVPIERKSGVLFSTYSTLGKGFDDATPGKLSRLEQIVNWLGKDYDGVLIFDEAHNMGNASDQRGPRGVKKASNRALAGLELQKRLPNARIVYASATGATEVSNLAYVERLGLWGLGTAFPNREDFISKINAGGIAAMELVARDMKAMGLYIARNLSYNGVEYQKLTHTLTSNQAEIYDTLARSWQIVLQNINQALEIIGATKDGKSQGSSAKKNAAGQFWSAQQRFFNQVLTAMQMPKVLEEARKDLKEGKAIVMQLVNTNEASQDRQIAKIEAEEGDLEDLDLTPRDILLQFVDKSFPVIQHEEYIDDNGNRRSRPVEDSHGNPVINTEAQAMKDDLMMQLSAARVPEGPLEMVLNEFGADNVAEITGRSQRVVQRQDENTGRMKRELESRTEAMKETDTNDFMDGKKNILVFSNAGGTGRSYHADRTRKNQKQRMHYLIQAGWEATKAVQGFGRSHRTNQASSPVYKLFTTNLKGQMRFVSSIARRLDQLGALTKGQRQTGSQGLFSAADNLEGPIAKRALEHFYQMLIADQFPHLDKRVVLGKMGLADKLMDQNGGFNSNADELTEVTKFLNRILTLESGEQNQVFDTFQSIVERLTEIAFQDGVLDTGLENIKADTSKIVEEREVHKSEGTGGVTKYVQAELGHKSVKVKLQNEMKFDSFEGVYRNERSKAVRSFHEGGNKTLASGRIVKRYRMQGQERFDFKYVDEQELESSTWKKLQTREEANEEIADLTLALQAGGMNETQARAAAERELLIAEVMWDDAVKKVPEYRKETVHMITGTLLPIWDRLPTDRVRVVRLLTDDGDMILGRIIPENQIDNTLYRLGAEARSRTIDLAALASKIMDDGHTVYLANGWKLSRRRVSNEWRIEITGDNLYKHATELKEAGVFTERIGYDYRYFIPTGDAATETIQKLTKHHPVAEIVAPESSQQGFAAPAHMATVPVRQQRQGAPAAVKPIKRSAIYQHITKSFKVPIGTGRYRSRALGLYTKHINEIRSKMFGDFVVLAHELGHRLDNLYKFSSQSAFDAELMTLAGTLQIPKGMTKKEQRAEGFAEFTRLYLYDPQNAQNNAPQLYDHFEDVLKYNRQYKAMRELYDMLQSWYFQDARAHVQSVTDLGVPKPLLPTVGQLSDRIYDELGGIDRAINSMYDAKFVDRLKLKKNNTPQGKDNPAHVAWRARGAAGRIKAFLHWGPMDEYGNKVGKSLEEIMKSVPDLSLFRDYLMSKRGMELHDQGRWKTPIDYDKAESVVDGVENAPDGKKYMDAFNDLTAFQNAITDELVKSGILSQDSVDQWRDEHLYYIPFYRVMEESGTREGSRGRGGDVNSQKYANLQNPVKGMKREGSSLNIIDPFESIIKNTYLFLSLAYRNDAGTALVDWIRSTPDSASIAAIVPPKTEVKTFSLLEIVDYLEAAGVDLNDKNLDLTKFASIFRTTFHPDPKQRILNVWENGGIKQVQIRDQDMYNSYTALEAQPVSGIVRFFGLPNLMLKAGIVLSPTFIPKNFARGLPTLFMQSDSFTTPKDYAELFPLILKNMGSALLHKEAYRKWVSTGGAHATLTSITNTYLKDSSNKILRDMWKDKLRRGAYTGGIGPVLKGLRHLAEALGDAPLRMSEQQKALEKTGDPVLAAVRSRDVDVDANRFGSNGRPFNTLNAFLNIALQGHNRVYRTFKNHPYRTMFRGTLFLTLPTILLYMINRDDEEYWKLPQWERDLYWIIPTGMDGPMHFLKIPIPFEWGLMFKTLPERIMASDAAFGDLGGKAFGKLHETALGMLIPSVIPTVMEPVIEWVTGMNFLNIMNANPVVPQGLQRKAPEDQYKSTTTETAKGLGKVTGQSPMKIENAIEGYTGTLGMIGLRGIDAIAEATGITDPPPKPNGSGPSWGLGLLGDQGLFAKTYFTSANSKGSQQMEDFYRKLDKAEAKHKKDVANKGTPPAELSSLRKTSAQMAAIRNMQEMIRVSRATDSDQKRSMIDILTQALNDMASTSTGQKATDPANMRKMQGYAVYYISNQKKTATVTAFVDMITKKAPTK